MTKTELHKAIEHYYGSGILMAFTDLIHEEREMITCKEDLFNTYIENDHGELRDLYVNKAIELGFSHQGFTDREIDWYNLEYIAICFGWHGDRLGQTARKDKDLNKYECRELTLSDLKPRTRTEYVKVTESIFDLKEEFERGELYRHYQHNEYKRIDEESNLASRFSAGTLYRRIETPITEREEFIEAACKVVPTTAEEDINVIGKMFDSGKFKLTDKE